MNQQIHGMRKVSCVATAGVTKDSMGEKTKWERYLEEPAVVVEYYRSTLLGICSYWALEMAAIATEELTFQLYIIFINLNLSSHMGLEATVSARAAPDG